MTKTILALTVLLATFAECRLNLYWGSKEWRLTTTVITALSVFKTAR